MNNEWLPYPNNKPSEEDLKADFVVLSPNPNFIKKADYKQNTPCYHVVQAIWTGTAFINTLWQPLVVDYYIQLPPFPGDKL